MSCRPVGRTISLSTAEALIGDGGILAEVVAETMTGLIAKSLVMPELINGEIGYRLLQTIRAHALAKLKETGEFDDVARRHAAYRLRTLERAEIDRERRARPQSMDSAEAMANSLGNVRAS